MPKKTTAPSDSQRDSQDLKSKMEKHLSSAITHGWNDAQEDNDGLSEVCRMEAQQNLSNAMADIETYVQQEIDKSYQAGFQEAVESIKAILKPAAEELDNDPDYLKFGEVCKHDDGFMCEHRVKWVIKSLKPTPDQGSEGEENGD